MPTETQVTKDGFGKHLSVVSVARLIVEFIAHHTWKPIVADYRGISTVRSVRRYHMNVRDWSDNGYHIMIGPDGAIYLCRPLRRSGGHCLGHNARSVGVNVIGNFDLSHDAPMGEKQYRTLVSVLAMLCARFKVPVSRIYPHSAFANKTCPGTGVDMDALCRDVALAMKHEIKPKQFRVSWAGIYLDAQDAELRGDTTWVKLRPVADIEGRTVHPRAALRKVFVK